MAQSLPSTLLSSLPSGPWNITFIGEYISLNFPASSLDFLQPLASPLALVLLQVWSHGPVLAFYPSFISPFRPWNITFIGEYTSFSTFQPHSRWFGINGRYYGVRLQKQKELVPTQMPKVLSGLISPQVFSLIRGKQSGSAVWLGPNSVKFSHRYCRVKLNPHQEGLSFMTSLTPQLNLR